VGFEAEFGDEVGEKLVEYFFGGIKGVRDVAVGIEEVLDCKLLKGDNNMPKVLTLSVREALLSSVLSDSGSGLHDGGWSAEELRWWMKTMSESDQVKVQGVLKDRE